MNIIRRLSSSHFLTKQLSPQISCNSRTFSKKSSGADKRYFEDECIILDSVYTSLNTRGYHRPQKGYTPPDNVEQLVLQACVQGAGTEEPDLSDPHVKLAVLVQCEKLINRQSLNCILHTLTDTDMLIQFYKTPVDIRLPLDKIRSSDKIPENLVFIDNKRFNPETDTMFNGVSAFPGESTPITGLKAKKKYKGFVAEPEWAKYDLGKPTNFYGIRLRKKTYKILEDEF